MSLPRYGEYRDSGVDWLRWVPTHWAVEPLKHGFVIVGGSTPKSDEASYWDGNVVWVSPADLSRLPSLYISDSARKITQEGLNSCGTTLVPSGSIVLSTRAPIGSLAIATTALCTNQGCKSLVPRGGANSLYFAYVLLSATIPLNLRGKGTTFLELSADELAAFRVPMPSSNEQAAIATFLDRETAKIDALIAEQEKLIALLAEKRQATISHAVTKGLNPNAPMKDSGVAWLGEVPEHWDVMPLRRKVVRLEQGWSPNAASEPCLAGGWGVLKISAIKAGRFVEQENKALLKETEPDESICVQPGDLLITRANTTDLVGDCCVVPSNANPRLMLSDLIYRLRLSTDCSSQFFSYVLRSDFGRAQIKSDARGSSMTMAKISQGHIASWLVPLPSLNEQIAIVAFLDTEAVKLDALCVEANRTVALLKERRSALITAAVTGQIDVRNLTPEIPA